MHQHPDSIVIPLTPSKVRFGLPDGKSQDSELANEMPQSCPPARTTRPTSAWTRRCVVDRIQDRGAGQGGASDVTPRPGAEGACRRSTRNRLSLDGGSDVRGTGWK